MKNINLLFVFLVLFLASCQKNQDVLETESETTTTAETSVFEFSWRALVQDMESVVHFRDSYIALQNVSVKLMARGVVIAQTNTDENGSFEIGAELVPADAYVLFESPGYHNTVVKVIEGEHPGWQLFMIRNTHPDITREITSSKENYINLTGRLEESFNGRNFWFYLTNEKDELVGTATRLGDLDNFKITTLPNEELFFHYGMVCSPEEVIPLGSFSEDTVIGEVLDQPLSFSNDHGRIHFTSVNNCAGDRVFGNDMYYKVNGLTKTGFGNTIVDILECHLPQPILVTATTQNPRKYQETTITLSSGSDDIKTEINICEDDDTFVHYTIGGSETKSDVFTFANILPDGRLVIQQPALDLIDDRSLSFVSTSSNLGNSKGDVLFYFSWTIDQGGNELDFNITKNDGEFVEGTVSGELYDTNEISQGSFEASFRARIQ